MYLRRLVSPHIWKRACSTFAAPAGVETSGAAAPVASGKRGKGKIFEKKKGISVTQADLLKWAKRFKKKEGRPGSALAIFQWLDRNKMTFSPSDLALYVELIAKVKGLDHAQDYFDKADPNFNNMYPKSKNWPAYNVLFSFGEDFYQNQSVMKRHVLYIPPGRPRSHGDAIRRHGGFTPRHGAFTRRHGGG